MLWGVDPRLPQHCPRLLALDGGGLRSLASLSILEYIEQELARHSNSSTPPLLYEYFDLIGGCGTGGLLAILLGSLRMVCSTS
jgi:patatin-like phospholipase/acyl hydrolase